MPLVTRRSPAAHTALGYITAGSLILVWSGVWLAWLLYTGSHSSGTYFLCTGTILTGLAVLVIGMLLGQIGKAAKPAEQPAEVATQTTTDAAGHVMTSGPAPAPVQTAVPPASPHVPVRG